MNELNMNQFTFLILGLIIFTSCTEKTGGQNKSIFNEGPVIVAGQLENAVNKRVKLIILEPTGRVGHITKTDENGRFQFNVEVLSAHDNYIHAGQLTTIYLEPNDSLYITGDAGNIDETIKFSGDNSNINNCIRDFNNELSKRLTAEEYFYKYTKKAETQVSPAEYKKIVFDFFDGMEVVVDSIALVQKADKKAIAWMKAYIKYREAEEILEYIDDFDGELPEKYAYFDNEGFLEREESDFFCSQYFEDFLKAYYLGYKLRQVDGFGKAISGYRDMTYEGVENLLDFLNEHVHDTLYKNIFLTMLCNSLIEADYQLVDSIYPKYAQLVNDITCQNFIRRRVTNEKAKPSLVNTLGELASRQFIGDIFNDIRKKCNGKVVYIDVWGTWCGGCVNALRYANELHNSLAHKDVEFVYLCLMSKENDWKRIRKKYKLEGLHYLLDKKQYVEIGDVLNISGVPRYIIIDKEGNIVDDNAKPPYSSAIKEELLTLTE